MAFGGGPRLNEAPSDILGLLDAQGGDFQPDIYLEKFAPWHWTYAAGYPALMTTLLAAEEGFRDDKGVFDYVKGQRSRALGRIPKTWKDQFPTRGWSDCNGSQIAKAAGGDALCLDKACLAIRSLELAFAGATNSALNTLDFYRYVRLRPAIYVLRDLDSKQKSLLQATRLHADEEKIYHDLIQRICALRPEPPAAAITKKAKSFLAMATEGRGITWNNAQLIKGFLHEARFGHVTIATMQDRTDGGRKVSQKECNTAEPLFVSLDEELAAALRRIKPARTSRK
jgi:hypothetical protein